jgi:hypothetical protein
MMRRLALLALAAGCTSYIDPPPVQEPLVLGPGLGTTHVVHGVEPPPPGTHTPTSFVETRRDLATLVGAVCALAERPADHARLVAAMRALANALFVVAGGAEHVAVLGEHRRVMLAEIDVLEDTSPDAPDQASRVRTLLDRAALAITGGSARAGVRPAYNLAAAQVAEAVRQIDPMEPLDAQHPHVTVALQRATDALHVALGLPAPFAPARATTTG